MSLLASTAGGQTHEPVQARSAAEALQFVLDRNIDPPGPLGGDGATIAGVLVGQSLTFPISSSSGAFAVRPLTTIGPTSAPIDVSMSGSFGSLFGERADTNGKGALSVSLNYQRKRWGSLAGMPLKGNQISARAVYRTDLPNGVAGTADDFSADIDYRTDVTVVAANYGLLDWADVGIALPWIAATVDGVKQRTLTPPASPTTLKSLQRVTGSSVGLGDVMIRLKARLVPAPRIAGSGPPPDATTPGASDQEAEPLLDTTRRAAWNALKVAVGFDLRLPTGRTAELYLDCSQPPCVGGKTQDVPDLGLGAITTKLLVVASGEVKRLSPYVNVSYFWVPSYPCDSRFSTTGRCKGSVFEWDAANGTPDAKNQNLSDEITITVGSTYQLVPYRATTSFDVIGRRLVRAGQFYRGQSRAIVRDRLDNSVSTLIESRPGDVDTYVGVAGLKVGFRRRWVAVASLLFPLNDQGLQPSTTWLVGLERALGR